MVKIIYAPPHRDAPFTHHSMPGFGPRLGQETRFTLWLMKQPQSRVILSAVGITIAICAIPQTVRVLHARFLISALSELIILFLITNSVWSLLFWFLCSSSFLVSFRGPCLLSIKPPTVHICVTTIWTLFSVLALSEFLYYGCSLSFLHSYLLPWFLGLACYSE